MDKHKPSSNLPLPGHPKTAIRIPTEATDNLIGKPYCLSLMADTESLMPDGRTAIVDSGATVEAGDLAAIWVDGMPAL